MKITLPLFALATLVIGVGCQSSQTHASNNLPTPESGATPTVTIESIPANRLSPTSREGDQPGAVYSSNIIAVYVNGLGKTNNGGVTNATVINLPQTQK